MDKLAQWSIGPGAQFPMRDVPPGQVVRVTVERIYGQGPWRDESAEGDAEPIAPGA